MRNQFVMEWSKIWDIVLFSDELVTKILSRTLLKLCVFVLAAFLEVHLAFIDHYLPGATPVTIPLPHRRSTIFQLLEN